MIKFLNYLFITINLFIIYLYLGIRSIWDGVDFALILNNYQIIFSTPISPYLKELISGSFFLFFSIYFTCHYRKFFFFLFLLFDIFYLIQSYTFSQKEGYSLFKREYIIPHVIPPKEQKNRNIIVISLESFEDLFTQKNIINAENLLTNLTNLKNSGTHFNGYFGMESMRPTIPSFISVNCGIPRGTNSADFFKNLWKNKNYGGYPNTTCLSDILAQYNYSTYLIMGAHLGDEGQRKFLEYHKMSLSVGKDELSNLGYSQKNSQYRIPDSELFKFAMNTLNANPQNKPFFLYLITGNTHGPKEYVIETFCSSIYNDGRDAYKCLDNIVMNFIYWCQKQPWYKDTTIYLIGDHLAWIQKLDFINKQNIKNDKRQIYNLILNLPTNRFQPQTVNKNFTQVDFAPTILESAGFKLFPRKWGIGVSLWGTDPTLVERLGPKKFAEELEKSQEDYFKIIYDNKNLD